MRDSLNKYVKIFAWIFPGIISIFLLSCNFKQQKHAEILFWGMGAEGEKVKSLILKVRLLYFTLLEDIKDILWIVY